MTRQSVGCNGGFSLLEMSVVVLIIGIMLASLLPVMAQQGLQEKDAEQAHELMAIEAALQSFRVKHNRLPCPSKADLAYSNADFAVEADEPGTCTGGTLAAAAVGADNVSGGVPVRTLGLSDDYAYDPWGRAYSYMVDERITAPGAFTLYAIDDATIGNITVQMKDQFAASVAYVDMTTRAVAVVLAHGANGHGAYLRGAARHSTGSATADEEENCNCDDAGADLDVDATFVTAIRDGNDAVSSAGYDDTVVYFLRSSFTVEGELD